MKTSTVRRLPALLAGVAIAALALAGCGSSGNPAGNGTDLAFIDDMAPHHQMAIDMAKTAQRRASHPEIKRLADDIIKAQQAEIVQLNAIKDDLHGVKKADLGIPAHMAGMDMDMAMLRDARPFDRGFIDAMVPHHQGAIRMARVELAKGKSPALRQIAKGIVDAQSRKIRSMNDWRTAWYGKPSPAGGIPSSAMSDQSGHSM